jgi:hypothetical protein
MAITVFDSYWHDCTLPILEFDIRFLKIVISLQDIRGENDNTNHMNQWKNWVDN